MLLGFRIVGAVAIALLLSGCDWLIDPAPDVIYLIPEHFSGWMCVDFEVANAPALPREGKAMVVRHRAGEVLETSEKGPGFRGEVWVEAGSARRPLPEDVRSGHQMSATGPNEPFQRVCRFVGTIDQEDASGNPPGLDYGWFKTRPVPESERAALVALFEAAGGRQWKHKVGWLGPAGTECNWHGVDCQSKYNESTTNVTRLDLHDNNLRGTVPEAVGDLPHLTWLAMGSESNVSGKLPAPLLRRWLAAELEVTGGPGSLFTDISAIEVDSSDFSWCGRRSIVLRPDGSASSVAERCGRLVPLSLRKHCELKTGWFYYQDFARLAHTIEQSLYFSLTAEYGRDVTDRSLEITRVTRNGRTHQVSDYGSAGPQELWTIRQAIHGVGNNVLWTDTKTQPECPAAH
jgi:hypothetical protein